MSRSLAVAGLAVSIALAAGAAEAQQVTVLHSFDPNVDGSVFAEPLTVDPVGNKLFGATGENIFSINADGQYDNAYPTGGNSPTQQLTFTPAHLFWPTSLTGKYRQGAIFSLSLATGQMLDLYDFLNRRQNLTAPESSLLLAPDHNLYGIAYGGGANGAGGIYELNSTTLAFSTVLSFPANFQGVGTPVIDANGTIWAVATIPIPGATYNFNIISFSTTSAAFNPDVYSFDSSHFDAAPAIGSIAPAGYFYGSQLVGRCGAIWRFNEATSQLQYLASFFSPCQTASAPVADPAGNLFFNLYAAFGSTATVLEELSSMNATRNHTHVVHWLAAARLPGFEPNFGERPSLWRVG